MVVSLSLGRFHSGTGLFVLAGAQWRRAGPSLTRASIRCRCSGTFPVDTGCGFPRPDRRISEDIAATPHRLDVMTATGRLRELFAQLADEQVDDLDLGLVHPAVEVVEEHLLRV